MGDPNRHPDRRDFLRTSLTAGAGAVALGRVPDLHAVSGQLGSGLPTVLTSHSNGTGQEAMREAWSILSAGGPALDAVERGANVIEVDPEDHSVGVAGLPNANGIVQLDASIMDGATYNAGSVASLERIATPSSVARLVMERTDHVVLVGPGALEFARSFGFKAPSPELFEDVLDEPLGYIDPRHLLEPLPAGGAVHLKGVQRPVDIGAHQINARVLQPQRLGRDGRHSFPAEMT